MKKLFLIVFSLLWVTLISAQNWETNLTTAEQKASEENRNILLVFSGSDWCVPCMKLEKNIWESKEFINDSSQHFVLRRADFPKRKTNALTKEQQKLNDKLAEKYNKEGLFPLVVLLDKTGKMIATTGYKDVSPHDYVAMLHSLEK